MSYRKKAVGIVGLVVVVFAMYSTFYATDFRALLNEECPADICNYLVIGYDDNDRLEVLTRGPEDYLRWLIHRDFIRLYSGRSIAASFDWTVEYYRTYGEDQWVRLYRKPSKIKIDYEPIDNETLLIVKTTPYYAYNYASGTGGLLVEEFEINSQAIYSSFPSKYSVHWIPSDKRMSYDHRLTWRLSDLEQTDKSPSGIIENPVEQHTHWFGHNVKVSWRGVSDLINLAFRDEIEEKLNVYFKPAVGEQLLELSVVDPVTDGVDCWLEGENSSGDTDDRTYEQGETINLQMAFYNDSTVLNETRFNVSIGMGGYSDDEVVYSESDGYAWYNFTATPSLNEFNDTSTAKNQTYSGNQNNTYYLEFDGREEVISCNADLVGYSSGGYYPTDATIYINGEEDTSIGGELIATSQNKTTFSTGASSLNLSYPNSGTLAYITMPAGATVSSATFNVTGSEGWLPYDYIPDSYSNTNFGGSDYCHDGLSVTSCTCSDGDECNSSATFNSPANGTSVSRIAVNATWSGWDSPDGRKLYLYNYTASDWDEVNSTSNDSQYVSITSDCDDYIDYSSGFQIKSGTDSGPLDSDQCNDNSISSLWTTRDWGSTTSGCDGAEVSCTLEETDDTYLRMEMHGVSVTASREANEEALFLENFKSKNFTTRFRADIVNSYDNHARIVLNDSSHEEEVVKYTATQDTGYHVWTFNYSTSNSSYMIYDDGVYEKSINVSGWDEVRLKFHLRLYTTTYSSVPVECWIDYVNYTSEDVQSVQLEDVAVRFDTNNTYNPQLTVAESGQDDWNYTGLFNDTVEETTSDLSTEVESYLDTCTPNVDNTCDVPISLSSDWHGTVLLDNLVFTYLKDYNPVTLSADLMNEYISSQSTETVDVPIVIEATNGTLGVEDIDCQYYGSIDDILVNVTFPSQNVSGTVFNASSNTVNFSIRHSNYSVDDAFDFLAFYPKTFSDKWVEAYGQDDDTPFWSIEPDAIDDIFNMSVSLDESLNTCITNVTVSNTSDYTDGVIVNTTQRTIIEDLFGYDADATYYGETFNSGTLTNMDDNDWVQGKFGSALEFDGTNDYVTIADNSELEAGTDFSAMFWAKPDDSSVYGPQIYSDDDDFTYDSDFTMETHDGATAIKAEPSDGSGYIAQYDFTLPVANQHYTFYGYFEVNDSTSSNDVATMEVVTLNNNSIVDTMTLQADDFTTTSYTHGGFWNHVFLDETDVRLRFYYNSSSDITLWHNRLGINTYREVLGKSNSWTIRFYNALPRISYWNSSDSGNSYGDNLLEDEWVHVAFTYDGTNVKVYHDGSLEDTDSFSGSLKDNSNPIRIGGYGGTSFYGGIVDEVRIYNHSLSADTISDIYENNTFHRYGLKGYWRLDEDTGTTAYDTHHRVVPDNEDGTVYGNALSFDGEDDYTQTTNLWSDIFDNDNSNDFSVSVWGKVDENKGTNYWWYVLSDDEPSLKSDSNGAIRVCHAPDSGQTNASSSCALSSNGVISEDTWHHAVVTWDHDYYETESSVEDVFEGFESGSLNSSRWDDWSDVAEGRIRVTDVVGTAYSGDYHVLMDSSSDGTNAKNAIITKTGLFDSAGSVELDFYARGYNEETDSCPSSWSGGYDSGSGMDCVAFTCDNNTWYRIVDLSSISDSYAQRTYNITADADWCGTANENFRIMFAQDDNYGYATDGIAYDNINITTSGSTSTNGSMSLFVDNVEVVNQSIPTDDSSFQPADTLKLGWDGTAGRCMNGTLDDFRIYNKVLSEDEISDLYSGIDVRDHIASHLRLNEENGTTLYDYPNFYLWVWVNLDNCDYADLAYFNPTFNFDSCCEDCYSCW